MDHYFWAIRQKNYSARGHSNNHHLIYISSLDGSELLIWKRQKIHHLKFLLHMTSSVELKDSSISTALLACHWPSNPIISNSTSALGFIFHPLCVFVRFQDKHVKFWLLKEISTFISNWFWFLLELFGCKLWNKQRGTCWILLGDQSFDRTWFTAQMPV